MFKECSGSVSGRSQCFSFVFACFCMLVSIMPHIPHIPHNKYHLCFISTKMALHVLVNLWKMRKESEEDISGYTQKFEK